LRAMGCASHWQQVTFHAQELKEKETLEKRSHDLLLIFF